MEIRKLLSLYSPLLGKGGSRLDASMGFLSELGELVDTVRWRWWDGNAYEKTVPEHLKLPSGKEVWDSANFFIEASDTFLHAFKLYEELLGEDRFVYVWEASFPKARRIKAETIKELLLRYALDVLGNTDSPERGVFFLAKHYKTFDRLAFTFTRGRSRLEELLFGKYLLLKLRLEKGYEKELFGIEDNRIMVFAWYEGALSYPVKLLKDGYEREAIAEFLGKAVQISQRLYNLEHATGLLDRNGKVLSLGRGV